ncbi:MAG TPA: methyltransferase domain-containing protein, partial [Planctomycetia bacterium]|nr:methyltransferase domain-containing protein [Planctomycetia bacterium]
LPFAPESFDFVFSIGVLHHSPDAAAAFRAIARMVRPGGRLSVWLYRRNSWPQERINDLARWTAQKLPRRALLAACRVGAGVGGIPVIGAIFSKVVNVSTHPDPTLRYCDTFDWYAPRYQSHHDANEVNGWFRASDFSEIRELRPAKSGKIYDVVFRWGLIPGSGVNLTGVKRRAS